MDASFIQAIVDLGAAQAQREITDSAVVLPSSFQVVSTEKHHVTPSRFRRAFTTRRFGDFVHYVKKHGSDASAVFISPSMQSITAVLNHGSPSAPEWGDDIATLQLQHEPEFAAFLALTHGAQSQRALIEFLEDWAGTPFIAAKDADGQIVQSKVALSAVRRVTVASKSEATHQQDDLRAARSALEEVEARGAGEPLPAWLTYTGMVFHGLPQYTINARLGVRLTDKEPTFVLRIPGWQAQLAQICSDAESMLGEQLEDLCHIYVGDSRGNYGA